MNALTDDTSGLELAKRFSFNYIPTSVFVRADGTIAETYTGPLAEAEMRARLDDLAAR